MKTVFGFFVPTKASLTHCSPLTIPSVETLYSIYIVTQSTNLVMERWNFGCGYSICQRYAHTTRCGDLLRSPTQPAGFFFTGIDALPDRSLCGLPSLTVDVFQIYEFIDTVFIALAHKPLDFLHVYHHVLTLWVTWFGIYTYASHSSIYISTFPQLTFVDISRRDTTFQWMGVATNTFVHTLMYFYYFSSTFGWWKRYLTQIQMVQFWFNTTVLVLWLAIKHIYGAPCVARTDSILLVIFANVTFFILFLRFYRRTYSKNAAARAASNAAAQKPKKL
jgi:hypothetical protein